MAARSRTGSSQQGVSRRWEFGVRRPGGRFDPAERLLHRRSRPQRVAIARALFNEPKVVIADEPTGNLDSSHAEIVLRLLQRIAGEMGHTVLMATHSRAAAGFASRVVSMRDGRLATP